MSDHSDMTTSVLTPQQIIEAALAASRTDGCVVVVRSIGEANVRWANNTVTTSGLAASLSWFVVAVDGRTAGTHAGSAVDAASPAAVAEVVAAAEGAARSAAASGPARDAQPLIEPGSDAGVDADFGDAPAAESFAVYDSLLPGLGAAFDGARGASRILYGFARHELTTTYLGSSTGLRRRWVQPTGTLEVNAKSSDLTRSSWAGASTADFTDVDVESMADDLTRRLGWADRTVQLEAGRYDTVLPPTSVADFLIHLAWSAGARAAYEGRSAFSAPGGGVKLGERVSDRPLELYCDPAEPGIESVPFVAVESSGYEEQFSVFDNGAPIGRASLVREGTLAGLVHTRATAAEYGSAATIPADNLVLRGGDESRSIDDLVAGVDRGLLVTSQWYLREVDPMTMLLTGLTRDGVYLIEHGEVTAAVNNFRFNMSPLDVLRRASDIGGTQRCLSREWSDWFTRSAMPPMRVDGFHMSSVSKAQ